jgi:drug/metabolite transporter (DMT)-like permease
VSGQDRAGRAAQLADGKVFGGSILAYLLWFHLLKVCGATAASAYHFLMPPLGMLFAFLVLGEHVEFRDLLGTFRSRSAFIW